MNLACRLRTRRDRLRQGRVRELVEERGRHLRAAGVLDAREDDRLHTCSEEPPSASNGWPLSRALVWTGIALRMVCSAWQPRSACAMSFFTRSAGAGLWTLTANVTSSKAAPGPSKPSLSATSKLHRTSTSASSIATSYKGANRAN